MGIVESLITFLHIIVCIIIIVAVLLQPGKSGDLGSMFGGGTSESIFGSSGAVPFLAKLTRILGVVFFATSLCLGYFAIRGGSSSVLEGVDATTSGLEAPLDADSAAVGTSLEDGGLDELDEGNPVDENPTDGSATGIKPEEKTDQKGTDKQAE